VDFSGGHASSSTCSGSLQAGTVIGLAATSDDAGYWVANNQGLVVACGDAPNLGGLTAPPKKPIVGIAATPDGGGYYLVASEQPSWSLSLVPYRTHIFDVMASGI
jgi:hypothetical protein